MKTKTALAGLLVALAAIATTPTVSADGSCDTPDVGTERYSETGISTEGDCGVHVYVNNPPADCRPVSVAGAGLERDCGAHVIV